MNWRDKMILELRIEEIPGASEDEVNRTERALRDLIFEEMVLFATAIKENGFHTAFTEPGYDSMKFVISYFAVHYPDEEISEHYARAHRVFMNVFKKCYLNGQTQNDEQLTDHLATFMHDFCGVATEEAAQMVKDFMNERAGDGKENHD